MKKRTIIFLLVFVFLFQGVYALGVSPAREEFNFEPGLEKTIGYTIFEDNPNMALEIYVAEELTEYVTLDKTSIVGSGTFTATLKLPNTIEVPGRHRILIGVRQKIDPELVRGNIGTAITIQVPIYIDVPFPGRYVELDLRGNDANIGEPINFQLDVISKGTEEIVVAPIIQITSGEIKVQDLQLTSRVLGSQQTLQLQKSFDTKNLNPGNYKATAVVDYGKIAKDEVDFRVGNLSIHVANYSSSIPIDGLQSFNIEIESGWNNNIDGAYAEVQFLNGSSVIESFKTTSTNLVSWEKKNITGYFDSSKFTKGFYDANITLFYYGKDQGVSSSKIVKVFFYNKPSFLIWFIIGGIGILIIVSLIILKLFFKNAKRKKK